MTAPRTELYSRDYCPIECQIYRRFDGITHKVWVNPWSDTYVIFGAIAGDIHLLFGDNNGIVADPAEVSADAGAGVLEPNWESPDTIAAGTVARFYIPHKFRRGEGSPGNANAIYHLTHFAIVGSNEDTGWFAYPITEGRLSQACPPRV